MTAPWATLPSVVRALVFVVAVLWISGVASAQPAPATSEADRLFEQGRVLAKAGDHAQACPLFARSLELDHSIGTLLNLADCHEQLGRLRDAWLTFTAAANESARSADVKRTTFARQRAATVAAKLTTVVVRVARPTVGLSITIAGHPVEPATEIVDLEEPGTLEVVATLPGHSPFTTSVTGVAGETVHVIVPAFAEPTVQTPAPVAMERRRGRVLLSWGLLAGAGATAITGTVFSLKARQDYNEAADGAHCARVAGGISCDPVGAAQVESAQRLATIGTVMAIGTGVLVLGAAVVYFTSPYESVTLAPAVSPQQAGVVLGGVF